MRKPKKTSSVVCDTPSEYGDNSNEEFIDIVWGILRIPVECTRCHCKTRTPYPSDEGDICPICFRKETYGY